MKEFKANVILGKKQIVLASLVVVLGVAVYLNWQFASAEQDLTTTAKLTEDTSSITMLDANGEEILDTELLDVNGEESLLKDGELGEDVALTEGDIAQADEEQVNADELGNGQKNLGDALFVNSEKVEKPINGKAVVDETYFANAALARTRARDEVTETISMVLNDENLNDEDKASVSAKAIAFTDVIEAESRIENLIKAKGFEDCIVYLSGNAANVVVKAPMLTQDEATQIKNIVVNDGKVLGENVVITEIN